MGDQSSAVYKLYRCDSLTYEERFSIADQAYQGTVVILFEIPEGWKWKIIHINQWDYSGLTGFEPLPLLRLFPEDAIELLRKDKVSPNFFAPPVKLPSIYSAPVPWDEWGGYFKDDFFPTTFLKLIKVNQNREVVDPVARLELSLENTFYRKLQQLGPAQEEWLKAKQYSPPPEPHERPFKIYTDIPLENIKNLFEEFCKQGWVLNFSLDSIPEHFTNSLQPEQKKLGSHIIWTGKTQKLKFFRRILSLDINQIDDNFLIMNTKGHINHIKFTSLRGGINPSDQHHHDEIQAVINRFT